MPFFRAVKLTLIAFFYGRLCTTLEFGKKIRIFLVFLSVKTVPQTYAWHVLFKRQFAYLLLCLNFP